MKGTTLRGNPVCYDLFLTANVMISQTSSKLNQTATEHIAFHKFLNKELVLICS